MIQKDFANNVCSVIKDDPEVIGLAAGGSWIYNSLDEYSDLDLILVTREKIAGNRELMIGYAKKFGVLLSAFTGEHVGEPRVLICLYDDPLLHVDIKFLTLPEFSKRVEDPVVVFERENKLSEIIGSTVSAWPTPDLQLMEDRFWTWVHYACLKIGRGEYFEAFDLLGDFRIHVLAPLLSLKHKRNACGLRRLETFLDEKELAGLGSTMGSFSPQSIMQGLENVIKLYKQLRTQVFSSDIKLNERAEKGVMDYLKAIKSQL